MDYLQEISRPNGVVYQITKRIRKTLYGGVFKATLKRKDLSEEVAIKLLFKSYDKQEASEDIYGEINFCRKFQYNHKNIIKYLDIWETNSYIGAVMPIATHGCLYNVISTRKRGFNENQVKWLFSQLLEAVHFMHINGVAFRDLSVENCLMFELEDLIIPVITDPGQVVYFNVNNPTLFADKSYGKAYRPPEIRKGNYYDPTKIDIFLLGYMIYTTLTCEALFLVSDDKDIAWREIVKNGVQSVLRYKRFSPSLKCLLSSMLDPNYKKRPTALECLSHDFFKSHGQIIHVNNIYQIDEEPNIFQITPLDSLKEFDHHFSKNSCFSCFPTFF